MIFRTNIYIPKFAKFFDPFSRMGVLKDPHRIIPVRNVINNIIFY